ncbi:MAG: Arc family DNA-binding protein [Betaproteobacteria bacterium]|nr:Arc family DNA-binding protein [Betaproteobacteria bacterium]
MAQLIVRNIEEEVKARLKARAERNGRSVEEEVRYILRDAVKGPSRPVSGLGSRIASRFGTVGLPGDLPELRGQDATPIDLSS